MYNPYAPFDLPLLNALCKDGRRYFVRQNFARGANPFVEGFKASLLFTDYTNLDEAERHIKGIRWDPRALLYDATLPDHRQRLETAAAGVPGFLVFANYILAPWTPTPEILVNIRKYIAFHLRDWRVGPDDDIRATIDLQNGLLWLTLQDADHKTTILFDAIEPRNGPL